MWTAEQAQDSADIDRLEAQAIEQEREMAEVVNHDRRPEVSTHMQNSYPSSNQTHTKTPGGD